MRLPLALVALLSACGSPQAPPSGLTAPVASASAAPVASASAASALAAPTTSAARCVPQGVRVDFLDPGNVCCAGLKPLGLLSPPVGAICVTPPPGPAIGECWPSCGNKVCEAGRENRCNCPADCR